MRFFTRRIVFYAITAWAAITINFFIPRIMPGDPVSALIAKNQGRISPDAAEALRALFGLDEDMSLWDQYVAYWKLLLQGDLGISFTYMAPVADVIRQALPWTIGLVGIATIISFTIGTLVGTGIGWRRGTWMDGLLPLSDVLLGGAVLLARPDRHLAVLGDARLVPRQRQLRPQPWCPRCRGSSSGPSSTTASCRP